MALDPQVSSASLAAAASIANTTVSAVSSYRQYKRTKKLMGYQNDLNIENWNRQNEYNLPVNQVQRYRDAGLNPALLASNGSLSAGNADGVPGVSNSQYSDMPISPSSFIQNYQDIAQLDKVNSEVRNINSQTDRNLLELLFGRSTLNSRIAGEKGFQDARGKALAVVNSNLSLQSMQIKQAQQDYVTGAIQQDILQSNLPWLKGQEQFRLANLISNTYMQIASGDLSYQESKKLTTDMLVNYGILGVQKAQIGYYNSASYANYASGYNSYMQGENAHERTLSSRIYRAQGGLSPSYLKNLHVRAQKELSDYMNESNYKWKQKEWMNNPHLWISDVKMMMDGISNFVPAGAFGKVVKGLGKSSDSSGYNPKFKFDPYTNTWSGDGL